MADDPEPIDWPRLREIAGDIEGRRERYADAWMLAPRATLDMLPGRTSEQNTWITPAPDLYGIRVILDEAMPPGSWRILTRDGHELERGGFPMSRHELLRARIQAIISAWEALMPHLGWVSAEEATNRLRTALAYDDTQVG